MNRRFFTLLLFVFAFGCHKGTGQPTPTPEPERQPSGYRWVQLTEAAAFPVGYGYPVYVVGDRMWLFHSESVWSSTNGQTWTRSTLPSVRKTANQTDYVLFNNAVYAIGDNTGNYLRMNFRPTIRRTTDFKTWKVLSTKSNLPNRIFRGVVVFNGKIWLLGGYDGKDYYNDVWNSSDGVTWTRVVEHAEWSPRTSGTLVEFNGRLYMLGGGVIDGEPTTNPGSGREIWWTADGKQWTKLPDQLPSMNGGTPVVYDGRLWLIGTNRDGVFGRSSMVTSDFVDWSEHRAPWTPRGAAAAWVFKNRLYMTGGKYSVTENGQIRFIYSNDIWRMEPATGSESQ